MGRRVTVFRTMYRDYSGGGPADVTWKEQSALDRRPPGFAREPLRGWIVGFGQRYDGTITPGCPGRLDPDAYEPTTWTGKKRHQVVLVRERPTGPEIVVALGAFKFGWDRKRRKPV